MLTNFHDKDRLETEVCRMVCRDHSMTLQAGQAIFDIGLVS